MNHRTVALVVALALAPFAAGCSSMPEGPEGSGFLGDYSMLRPHPTYAGTYRWEKPGIDLRDYDSLLFDAVEVRLAPGSSAASLGSDELARSAARFREVLVETVSPFYDVVDVPGAHTLRVRCALTDVIPGATGEDAAGAGIEGELLDAATGERLAATVSKVAAGARPTASDVDAFRLRALRFLDYLDSHDVGGN